MEHYTMKRRAERPLGGDRGDGIVGVVASGNCEALFERALPDGEVEVEVTTAVKGFEAVWRLVVDGFVSRASPGGLRISINDGGATPDVVTLRLLQGAAMMSATGGGDVMAGSPVGTAPSWFEASARQRVAGLLDAGSFAEFLPPPERVQSPHLAAFDLPAAFDDGVVVGRGRLDGADVLVAAQEGQFMGGTFAEVSGAKLLGLLRAARDGGDGVPRTVLLLLDSGGVRLQEANAGELAVAEVMRAIAEARAAGVAVVAAVGGKSGAFGGAGLTAATCSAVVVSEQGRIGVTGPEVIETNKGVEEFDAKDKGLVWSVVGGRNRRLIGGADVYAADTFEGFRAAIAEALGRVPRFEAATLRAENDRLAERLTRFAGCEGAADLWAALGVPDPAKIRDMPDDAFVAVAKQHGVGRHDAR